MAEVDVKGNVNVSRFGAKLAGAGGFINISQNARKLIFAGTFTTGKLVVRVDDGGVHIEKDGQASKFIEAVQQITFSGSIAAAEDKSVIYVTERCVFRLTSGQLELIEVAPGIDIDRDVLDKMKFRPIVRAVRPMSAKIFQHGRMGLTEILEDLDLSDRLAYDRDRNILFLNFEGLRVRSPEDIETIRAAVADKAAQIGRRVAALSATTRSPR
jgi:propionate CoA-transferase